MSVAACIAGPQLPRRGSRVRIPSSAPIEQLGARLASSSGRFSVRGGGRPCALTEKELAEKLRSKGYAVWQHWSRNDVF